jgi:hypothetical protein
MWVDRLKIETQPDSGDNAMSCVRILRLTLFSAGPKIPAPSHLPLDRQFICVAVVHIELPQVSLGIPRPCSSLSSSMVAMQGYLFSLGTKPLAGWPWWRTSCGCLSLDRFISDSTF